MNVMISVRTVSIQLTISFCAGALIYLCTLALPEKAEAAVYKCTDANDNISYSQVPCVDEDIVETVLSTNSTRKENVDCRVANNFARQVTVRMRSGQSSGAIFDSYGGIDSMPRTSVGIISYVFSHKDNINAGAQRITALSSARCTAGSYGPVGCDDFPYEFIAELGGCEQAKTNTTSRLPATTSKDQATLPSQQEGTTAALGARTSQNQKSDSTDCKNEMQAQLSKLLNQTRSGQSDQIQGHLESRKKETPNKLANC